MSVGSKAHKEGKQTQLGPSSVCLPSLHVMRHLWYLAPDTVVFCLFDPETSDVEKREVARAIVRTPRPATIHLGEPTHACADAC